MLTQEEIIQSDNKNFTAVWITPNNKTFAGHAKHVASLTKPQPPVSIHGVELHVPPHVYHPGIGLSSRFLVNALYERALVGSVLDLGCGSGFVGISIHRPGIDLVLADVSEAALASTSENLRRLDIQAEVVKSDLFEGLRGRRFDAVIFNPPLFDKEIEHEAELALCDPDGELISSFLHDAHDHLSARGKLYFIASNLMNRSALLEGLGAYKYEIIAATHNTQSEVSRWVICAERA